MKFIAEALAENKVLLTKVLKQTYEDIPLTQKFPIETEDKLVELDKEINAENKNQYVRLFFTFIIYIRMVLFFFFEFVSRQALKIFRSVLKKHTKYLSTIYLYC